MRGTEGESSRSRVRYLRWTLLVCILVLPFSLSRASGPDTPVTIDPAAVSTLAGSGSDATVDGVGAAASFKQMGGAVVVDGSVHVGSWGAIRKVEVATGTVSTLAGHASATGCTDSATGSLVRFNFIYDVATDGANLFTVGTCVGSSPKIRRTVIATGATSTVSTLFSARHIVYGADGMLYVTTAASKTVVRVDPSSGAQTTVATLAGDALAITGDSTYLWVAVEVSSSDRRIQRVTIADGTVTSLVTDASIGLNALQSAGSYLYGTFGLGHGLRRYEKASGAWRNIAGTSTAGYVDGTGTDAWLSDVVGIASDGVTLWLADSGNRRVRKAVDTDALSSGQQSSAVTTLLVDPGAVTTVAGSGADATTDGVGTAASFRSMGGVVVVNGNAYVGTLGSIRRVNIATGEVSTLAGHATNYSTCTDSSAGAAVRFVSITDVATDGYYLYSAVSCPGTARIRRTSIATGATSTIASLSVKQLAFASDGMLYATTGSKTVVRVDPITGSTSTFVNFASEASSVDAITADATDLYVTLLVNGSSERRIKRIALSTGAVSNLLTGQTDVGLLGLESAGDYLYGTWGLTGPDAGIRRYTKSNGALINTAGVSVPGYANGTGTDAWFSSIAGIATDGTSLWIADSGNRRLRKAIDADPLPGAQSPVVSTTATLSTAAATTFAGDGVDATVDGPSREASFRQSNGVVVVGPNVYVGTYGSIRKLDLSSGAVSTLAGHPTEVGSGCPVDSPSAENVRFSAARDLATDGYYLYSVQGCASGEKRVRRTSIATGATSTITSFASSLERIAYGPDGKLYGTTGFTGTGLVRIDPLGSTWEGTGYLSNFYTFAITADDQAVYAVVQIPGQSGLLIKRVAIPSGTVTTLYSANDLGSEAIESAGDYLYATFGQSSSGIRRISKLDGSATNVVGDGTFGYADGIGSQARFSVISDIATDGNMLWVIDDYTNGNRRLRLVADLTFFMGGQSNFGWDGYGGWWEGVNSVVGNFVTSLTDAKVETIGPDLTVARTYNSLDTRIGAFGTGWSFGYEMTWKPIGIGGVAILYPDGRREVHTKNADGSYRAPKGYFSTLASDGNGGFVLTQKDRTVHRLDSDRRLVSITDANGHVLSFTYDDGKLATATDQASGRRLTFTWSGNHISTVATDSVTAHGGSLVWKYYYTSDLLDKVCDPRDNSPTGKCATYTYTAGKLTKLAKAKGNTDVELAYLANGKVDWRADGLGNLTNLEYPSRKTVTVTDPRTNASTQLYDDQYRLTSETDPLGRVTTFGYDANGNRDRVTDPNNNISRMTYDARGNLETSTNPENETTYRSYDSDDNLTVIRDPRSSSATDDTYATRYEYDGAGNRTKETSPALPDFPSGIVKRWTYTTGTEPAIGGGTMPPGLLRTEIDGRQNTTTYSYSSAGDLREVVDRVGLTTTWTHDEIGRKLTETVTSDAFPSGVTTTFTYDEIANVRTETGPAVSNVISGASHQAKTTNVYDANGNLDSRTVEDLSGGDTTRATSYTYDARDRLTDVLDAAGGTLSRRYDAAGNVWKVIDQEGRVLETEYDERNLPKRVIARSFVDDPIGGSTPRDIVLKQFTYDLAGRKQAEIDALARTRQWGYDKADRILSVTLKDFVNRDSTTRDIVLEAYTYNAAGHVLTETTGGGKRSITHTYDAAGRRATSTLDLTGLNRLTTYGYDANGNVTLRRISDGTRTEEMRYQYDAGDRTISRIVENGTQDLETTFTYDQRGNLTSTVDPRGNVSGAQPAEFKTDHAYDELNRRIRTTLPPVSIEENGGTPSTTRPVTEMGYDTFGNQTHSRDARGLVTVERFDRLDRRDRITFPEYQPPGGSAIQPTELFAYDRVGNLTSQTSRRGHTTDYDYDNLNRVVRQRDPLLTGESARGEIRYTYEDAGNRSSLVDQRGARTEWTYDSLHRVRTETEVVRREGQDPALYTTTFDYDDLGNRTYVRTPKGDETTNLYSAASELLRVTDPLGKQTNYTYDLGSRTTRVDDPLARSTRHTYDLAGRLTETRRHDRNGNLLTTTGFGYDSAGNQTSVTPPRGFTTSLAYDAANRLSSVTQPVSATDSIVTGYGYDQTGNNTRFTNGEGRATVSTYNPWSLVQDVIEPATTAHPAAADRTFTNIYDAGGLAVEERQPGGVVITRTFDELGRLRTESGSGGGATAAARSVGYDLAGLRTSVNHPGGTITFSYDDRRLITASAGPAGSATYSYDESSRLVSRTDPAGAHSFAWTARDELDTATDPITGLTFDYSWDDARQLTRIKYGTGGSVPQRDLAYDDLGRLTTDVLKNASGTETARLEYGYDVDSNVTSQLIQLPGNSLAGEHTYAYDRASRPTSWTPPGAAAISYGWDKAGNRTSVGTDTYTYDERNRLISAPAEQIEPLPPPPLLNRTFTYTPRGTLSQVTDGVRTETYSFDALGRLTNYSDGITPVPYTYDGLDRIATRNGQAFSYAGQSIDPSAQGSWTFSRSPAGRLLALSDGPNDLVAGLNRHGDLSYLATSAGAVSDTRIYDPFGSLEATTGSTASPLGFQADYTDPASKHVWMGARWYDGADANFLARDSYSGELRTPVSLNRYTYANANPLAFFDPDGHRPADPDGPNETTGTAARASGDTAAAQSSRGQQRTPKPAGWASWSWEQRKYWVAGQLGGEYLQTLIHKNRSTMGFFAEALFSRDTIDEAKRASIGFLKGVGDVGRGVARLAGGIAGVAFHPERAIARVQTIFQKQGIRGLVEALDRNFNPIHALRASAQAYVSALRSGDYEQAGRAGVGLSVTAGGIVYGARTGFEFVQSNLGRTAAGRALLPEGEIVVPQTALRTSLSPRAPAIGFAPGEGVSALPLPRLQHGTRHLVDSGVLPPWRASSSPQLIRETLSPILERPLATFDEILGGTRVKGFLGNIDGQQVATFVFKEGPYQGQLATSFVPSAKQLSKWGLSP